MSPFLGLLALAPLVQDPGGLGGRYFGELQTAAGETRVLRLDLAGDGGHWSGTLDLLDEDRLGLPLASVEATDTGLAFEVAGSDLGPLWFDARAPGGALEGTLESESGSGSFYLVESVARTQEELEPFLGWYGEEGGAPLLVTWDPYGALVLVDFAAEDGTTLLPREDGSFAHWEDSPAIRRTTRFVAEKGALVAETRFASGSTVRAPRRDDLGFRQELVEYPSGEVRMAGMLLSPRSPGPHPALVVLPGSGHETRERVRELVWARAMIARGFVVLLYDKRGCGVSGGDWRDESLLDLAGDALAGVRFLASRPDVRRDAVGLYGLSQGATVAPLAANRSTDVAFVISDSGSVQGLAETELGFLRGFLQRAGLSEEEVQAALALARLRFEALRGPEPMAEYRRALEAAQGERWCDPRYLGPLELPPDDWRARWWRGVLDVDSEGEWRSLRVPTLVLYGEEDSRCIVADELAALRRIVAEREDDAIEIEVYADAGHCLAPTRAPGHFVPGALERMAAFASAHARTDERQGRADDSGTGWTTTNLDLEVVVLPEDHRLEVAGTMRLRLDRDASFGPTIAVNADRPVMRFERVDAPLGVEVVLESGLRGTEGVRLAHLRASEPYARGDEVELFFEVSSEGRADQLLVSEEIALASWTTAWHPLPIPAEGEALSAKLKTVGSTTLNLPPGWTAACNGALISREVAEYGTVETWRIDVPVARSFAAGPFHVALREAGERRIRVFRLAEIPDGEDRHAAAAAAAVVAMEARLGPFPYDDFAIVEVPGRAGPLVRRVAAGARLGDVGGLPDRRRQPGLVGTRDGARLVGEPGGQRGPRLAPLRRGAGAVRSRDRGRGRRRRRGDDRLPRVLADRLLADPVRARLLPDPARRERPPALRARRGSVGPPDRRREGALGLPHAARSDRRRALLRHPARVDP